MTTMPAYSPYQGISSMLGTAAPGQTGGMASSPTQGIAQIVQALLTQKAQQSPGGIAPVGAANPSLQNMQNQQGLQQSMQPGMGPNPYGVGQQLSNPMMPPTK